VSKIVSILSQATGLRARDVEAIIAQAPVSYKRYNIPKRNGGERSIAQPAREVKKLQAILMRQLHHLSIHPAATAYVRGLSIKDNAEAHAKNGPILKFDFENFFPSIRAKDWQRYCSRLNVFVEPEDVELSSRLFFMREPGSTVLRLAIGAPSSPWLSNVLMFDFDKKISELVAKDKVTYTRYADDLTFSAPRTGYLQGVEQVLRQTLAELKSPSLRINDMKTVFSTKKYRRFVTGLVLADDGRVTIGRDRKRVLRAALHRAFLGQLNPEQAGRLAGFIAYLKGVEPIFFERLQNRYGRDLISRLNSISQRELGASDERK
jgi:hypothetical protein